MFGAIYFGQSYFAGAPTTAVTFTPCGGAAFGVVYFGGYPLCVLVPPVPPVVPPVFPPFVIGGGMMWPRDIKTKFKRRPDEICRDETVPCPEEEIEIVAVLKAWLHLH
jgi:hypothetical protein